ncbi:hypothetical protein A2U01_0053524 [Trifolium medium]|uniref:Uncharacterized protein n=1 Tax=Trifolium medium TaxID=97028 RepID=A0A392R6U3_9FABA|nr:hypothetical protein [Trifolium medium]
MATWEDKAEILRTFPNFNLEDKVKVNGGSIVRNIIEEPVIGNEESMTTNEESSSVNDHVAIDPQRMELRRSIRERKANPKYNKR